MKTQLTPNQLTEMARHKAVTVPQNAPSVSSSDAPTDHYDSRQTASPSISPGKILPFVGGIALTAAVYLTGKRLRERKTPVEAVTPIVTSPPQPKRSLWQPTKAEEELVRLYAGAVPLLSESERNLLRTEAMRTLLFNLRDGFSVPLPDLAAIPYLSDLPNLPVETRLTIFSSLFSRYQSLEMKEKDGYKRQGLEWALTLKERNWNLLIPMPYLKKETDRIRNSANALTDLLIRSNEVPREQLFNASLRMLLHIERQVRTQGITASLISPDFIEDVKIHAETGEEEAVRAIQHYLYNETIGKGEQRQHLDLFRQSFHLLPLTEQERVRLENVARELELPIGNETDLRALREGITLSELRGLSAEEAERRFVRRVHAARRETQERTRLDRRGRR